MIWRRRRTQPATPRSLTPEQSSSSTRRLTCSCRPPASIPLTPGLLATLPPEDEATLRVSIDCNELLGVSDGVDGRDAQASNDDERPNTHADNQSRPASARALMAAVGGEVPPATMLGCPGDVHR